MDRTTNLMDEVQKLSETEIDDLLKQAMREAGYTEVILDDGSIEKL